MVFLFCVQCSVHRSWFHHFCCFFSFFRLVCLLLARFNSFLLNGEVQWHSCSISLIRQNVDQANINLNDRKFVQRNIAKLILMAICFPLKKKSHFPIYCIWHNIFQLSLFCLVRKKRLISLFNPITYSSRHARTLIQANYKSEISNRIVWKEIAGN